MDAECTSDIHKTSKLCETMYLSTVDRCYFPTEYRAAPVKTDAPFKALNDWNDHLNRLHELESIFPKKYPPLHRAMSPPVYTPSSRPKSIHTDPLRAYGYNYAGQPIHVRTIPPKPLRELFEPNTHVPISRFVRDPWWWDYPELKPYEPPQGHNGYKPSPFYLRNSYLSPVKRTYLWGHHPIRPFSSLDY